VATDTRSLPSDVTSDANFRTWGSGLAAQLAAIGLVQTSDSGQINWATVLAPASGVYAGYEIWRFNDTLQATKPVFIKVEYGTGTATGRIGLRVTISTATNGAGTPTGQVSAARVAANSTPAGSARASYCSGSTSRLNLFTNDTGSAGITTLVLIERTKTGDGVDTGDGIIIWGTVGAGSVTHQFVPFSGSIPATIGTNPALDLSAGALMVVGPDTALAPTQVFYGKPLFASWCAYRMADITELTPITVSHLGGSHTYMPLGDGAQSPGHTLPTTAGYSIAMLWE
jgi:hypothetical protein